jgi:hypothetical protein
MPQWFCVTDALGNATLFFDALEEVLDVMPALVLASQMSPKAILPRLCSLLFKPTGAGSRDRSTSSRIHQSGLRELFRSSRHRCAHQ